MPTDPARLDAAIRGADPAQPDTMEELAAALAAAELLVPIQPAPGEDASLVILQDGDTAYVPAYTTPEAALGAVPEEIQLRRIPVRELAERWPPEVALALNAGAEPGGWLEGEGVRRLAAADVGGPLDQPATSRLPAGTEVALGEPEEEPEALLEVIGRWLDADGRVEAAYRGVMARAGHGPRWIIGLVGAQDEGEFPVAIVDVAAQLAASLAETTGGAQVDVLALDPDAPDGIGGWLLEHTEAFWRRTPSGP